MSSPGIELPGAMNSLIRYLLKSTLSFIAEPGIFAKQRTRAAWIGDTKSICDNVTEMKL
jgi:hypothetical protein